MYLSKDFIRNGADPWSKKIFHVNLFCAIVKIPKCKC